MISLEHVSFEPGPPPPLAWSRAAAPVHGSRVRWPAALPVRQQSAVPVALSPLANWALERAGLDSKAYRTVALNRRVPSCLRALRATSESEALAKLERRPEQLALVIELLLIGVSEFFRDPPVFKLLEDQVLPNLQRKRDSLRVCSAGCSRGQELYSVAMLLEEHGALRRSHLLGLDCRPGAVTAAQGGRFAAAELEGVNERRLEKHFVKEGATYRIANRLRDGTQWRVENLLRSDRMEEGGWDLVLFRNVGIYLEMEEVNRLWKQWVRWLRAGGVLVTGKAERPPAGLPLVRKGSCIYEKTGEER